LSVFRWMRAELERDNGNEAINCSLRPTFRAAGEPVCSLELGAWGRNQSQRTPKAVQES